MTTTDAAKLREAANWVLQQDDNCEQDELLARHVLATVPEDGEVTIEWLKIGWHWNNFGTMTLRAKTATLGLEITWNNDDGFSLCTSASGMAVYTNRLPITTRNQFRQLAAALGIQPTKNDSKLAGDE